MRPRRRWPPGRSPARFARDLDVPARLFDEAVDLTQAEAGSLPGLLGREEWFEYPPQNVLRHASASVADGNSHVWPGDKFIKLPAVLLIKHIVFGCDRQLPACGHGVARVHGEIEYRSLQLD